MEFEEKIMNLIKIETDLSDLKAQSTVYSEQIKKLYLVFKQKSKDVFAATEVAQEISYISQLRRSIDIKIDFLEQAKVKLVHS